jgi:phenylpropionate dioxygenase-like ring-hydroxylating dioxygenase large terminal subunit
VFEGFARVWTPVAMTEDLQHDRPLAVQIAGTKVVLFRDAAGKAVALLDRCPHRGAALSLGKVKDGGIECPFHGWRLEASGQVCHVPWNPDAKTATLRGVPLPVREVAGQVWVFTSVDEAPAAGPDVHEAFLRNDVRICGFSVEWKTHWTRAMENMLDWPHLPYVHRKTIGKGMRGKTDKRADIRWEETPWGAHTAITIDGEQEQVGLDFRWPNMMNLFIPIPGRTMIMQVACVPVDGQTTRMLLVTLRDFLRPRVLDLFFHRANRRIADEDRAIVESSFPVEVPPASEERSVRTDGPTLAFRKRYFAELRGTSSGTASSAAAQGATAHGATASSAAENGEAAPSAAPAPKKGFALPMAS